MDFTHTFQNENQECFINTLDHILTLERSNSDVVDAGVLHLVENMSDHEPIYAVLKIEHGLETQNEESMKKSEPKPSWKKAT